MVTQNRCHDISDTIRYEMRRLAGSDNMMVAYGNMSQMHCGTASHAWLESLYAILRALFVTLSYSQWSRHHVTQCFPVHCVNNNVIIGLPRHAARIRAQSGAARLLRGYVALIIQEFFHMLLLPCRLRHAAAAAVAAILLLFHFITDISRHFSLS